MGLQRSTTVQSTRHVVRPLCVCVVLRVYIRRKLTETVSVQAVKYSTPPTHQYTTITTIVPGIETKIHRNFCETMTVILLPNAKRLLGRTMSETLNQQERKEVVSIPSKRRCKKLLRHLSSSTLALINQFRCCFGDDEAILLRSTLTLNNEALGATSWMKEEKPPAPPPHTKGGTRCAVYGLDDVQRYHYTVLLYCISPIYLHRGRNVGIPRIFAHMQRLQITRSHDTTVQNL